MDNGPEAVAGAREMMADGARVQARVDAAEEHAQSRRDHIVDLLADRRLELLSRRAPRSRRMPGR
jgi:hypothetical protein